MTSSSRRKRRTIVWSSRRSRGALAILALAGAWLAVGACRRAPREPLITYFNADYRLSLQHPASWRTAQAQQEGVWYRYFLGPTTGPQRKPAVSATLLAGPLPGTIDDYAQTYLAGNNLQSSRDEKRPGLAGKSYVFATPDGAMRYSLLLVTEQERPAGRDARVFGLYCQGETANFAEYAALIDAMAATLTLERSGDWPEHSVPDLALALRLPASWKQTRRFSGGSTRIEQFASPALGADKNQQTVHALLTISVEPAPDGLDAYYDGVRTKLGPNFALVTHGIWKDGYLDVMHVETPMAASRIKRFYRVSNGRGYSLAFEARDDVYLGASRWFDLIADTLRVGPDVASR